MNIHDIWAIIFKLFRKKRFGWFMRQLKPQLSERIIDIGGYPQTWTPHPACACEIALLNVHAIEPVADNGVHHFTYHVADGCQLPFGDSEFDVVFSNSVIEHVGDWERQRQFASEARRVGKKLWIQTPAYEFWIEPHFLTPFIHWVSRETRIRLARNFSVWGWISRPDPAQVEAFVDDIRLLRLGEMQELFPDCQIIRERFLWVFTKSYIALRA